MSKLNSKTLTIAAVILVVLALLVMATPLLRFSGISGRSSFNRQFPGPGTISPGGQNSFPAPGSGLQGQGFLGQDIPNQDGSNFPNRQFGGRAGGLLGFGILSGMTGTIVYAVALLFSLAAAAGMLLTRRWGQILGIVMSVLYILMTLVSLLPMLLLGVSGAINGLSLGLSILRLVMALAVIVLALIPAKKATAVATPPAASA